MDYSESPPIPVPFNLIVRINSTVMLVSRYVVFVASTFKLGYDGMVCGDDGGTYDEGSDFFDDYDDDDDDEDTEQTAYKKYLSYIQGKHSKRGYWSKRDFGVRFLARNNILLFAYKTRNAGKSWEGTEDTIRKLAEVSSSLLRDVKKVTVYDLKTTRYMSEG